jgi:hypothetical protein
MFKKSLFAMSALALVAAPVAAQTVQRTASPVSEDEDLANAGGFPVLLAIAAIAAGAIVIAVDDDDDEDPVSP